MLFQSRDPKGPVPTTCPPNTQLSPAPLCAEKGGPSALHVEPMRASRPYPSGGVRACGLAGWLAGLLSGSLPGARRRSSASHAVLCFARSGACPFLAPLTHRGRGRAAGKGWGFPPLARASPGHKRKSCPRGNSRAPSGSCVFLFSGRSTLYRRGATWWPPRLFVCMCVCVLGGLIGRRC